MIASLPRLSASGLCVWKVREKNTFLFLVSRSVEQHGDKTCAYNFVLWQGLLIMSRATTKPQQYRRRHQLPYLLYPHKNKSVFQWTSVPMLRGDSVNIRGGGCWGWLLRFPGCHPHLSRRAGVSLWLWPDITNSHWAVKCADPQVRITHFSLRLISSPNNERITTFQETVCLSFSGFILCSLLQRTRWSVVTSYFVCVVMSVRILIYKLARLRTLHHHLKRVFLCLRLFWWSNCLQSYMASLTLFWNISPIWRKLISFKITHTAKSHLQFFLVG